MRYLIARMLGEDPTQFGIVREGDGGGSGGSGGGDGSGAGSGNGGNSGNGSGNGGNGAGGGEAKTYTQADIDALQTKLTEAQGKVTQFEQSQLTDQQKVEQRATAAEEKATKAQQRVIAAEVKLVAKESGIVDPDTAMLLIKDKIEIGDDGEPKNVKALLDQLVKDKPYLVAPASGGGPANPHTSHGATPTAVEQIDRDFAKRRGGSSGFRIA